MQNRTVENESLGDTTLRIRLVPLLFALGTSTLLARLARRLYGERAAVWAVLLHALQPAAFFVGGWAFPDSPELFFWMLTLTCVWQGLKTCRPAWWLGAGAALGAGMLSKYTAAFLVPVCPAVPSFLEARSPLAHHAMALLGRSLLALGVRAGDLLELGP